MTSLAKVRLIYRDQDPIIRFTLLPVSRRSDGQID